MRFLALDEARLLERKLRRQIARSAKPKLVLYYKSSNRDYADAASAITASIGEFGAATLLFLFCVSGDGWNEETAENTHGAGIGNGDVQATRGADCVTRRDTISRLMNLRHCLRS